MFGWGQKRIDGFPDGFRRQSIGGFISEYVRDLPPIEVAEYLRTHPDTIQALIQECADKRYTPSTFLRKDRDGFSVGWFSRQLKYECVRHYSDLSDAATDYLLFSLGRGRWSPPTLGNPADVQSDVSKSA
jgi:hypothetical protein